MGKQTGISWTDHTFNPWRGCEKVSEGCANCYAETLSHRNPAVLGEWGKNGRRVVGSEAYWRQPIAWNREAEAAGVQRRVFCASLADVFEDRDELINPRIRLFDLITRTPNLDWLLLTKRPAFAADWLEWSRLQGLWPLPNVWIGTSVENQARADERIPHLLRIPARVRFLSCEPLLERIEFSDVSRRSDAVQQLGKRALDGIHWVIVGGESGTKARWFDIDWATSIRDQCKAAGVAFFVKQLGSRQNQDLLKCPECGWIHVLDAWDVIGADDDKLFCNGCNAEVTPEDATPKDRAGADPAEWPEDLRIQEFPS